MKQGKAPYIALSTLQVVLDAQQGLHANRDRAILMLSHYIYDLKTGQIKESVRLLACMTKGERFREVFLTNEKAKEMLRAYLSQRSLRYGDAPLFLSQRGGAFSANTMQRLLAIMYKRSGINGSSHSGRRSYATHLIQLGADIYSIKELLGHASIVTTQAYFSTNPARLKQVVGLLL